jgi:hypothetical protein
MSEPLRQPQETPSMSERQPPWQEKSANMYMFQMKLQITGMRLNHTRGLLVALGEQWPQGRLGWLVQAFGAGRDHYIHKN